MVLPEQKKSSIEEKKRARDVISRSSEGDVMVVKTDFRLCEMSEDSQFAVNPIFHARQLEDECCCFWARLSHGFRGAMGLRCLGGLDVEI